MKLFKVILLSLIAIALTGCVEDKPKANGEDLTYKKFMDQKEAKPYLENMLKAEKKRQ